MATAVSAQQVSEYSSILLRSKRAVCPPVIDPRPLEQPYHASAIRSVLHKRRTSIASATRIGDDLPANYEDWLPKARAKGQRRAGILLHPTSLQGSYGIGDLGEQTFGFLDWLHSTGCTVWQVLPLVPPGRKANEDGSPYAGQDANCGNTLLISLEELVKDGLLMEEELPEPIYSDRVHFAIVAGIKDPLIAKAAKRLITAGDGRLKDQFEKFCRDPHIHSWLEDSAFFAAADEELNAFSWYDWPKPIKDRHIAALEEVRERRQESMDVFSAQQFLFHRQWCKVREYARLKNISIMGDMPIYVGYHSADVWANRKQFLLNRKGFPLFVSGVPPDAFSRTGQLWGSPLYDWREMESDGFSWWIKRVRRAVDLYDEFRIDHFRGFSGFWAVPAEEKVAMNGRWKEGPGKAVFDAIHEEIRPVHIVAEDLGVITEDVVRLRESVGAPGMAVLQFAFGGDAWNPHLPHNHARDQVVYTGTHDNDTVVGWWGSIGSEERDRASEYLGMRDGVVAWSMVRCALSSVARTVILPMQDVLGLGSDARMNVPATQLGNWGWRLPHSPGFEPQALRLRELLSLYGRLST